MDATTQVGDNGTLDAGAHVDADGATGKPATSGTGGGGGAGGAGGMGVTRDGSSGTGGMGAAGSGVMDDAGGIGDAADADAKKEGGFTILNPLDAMPDVLRACAPEEHVAAPFSPDDATPPGACTYAIPAPNARSLDYGKVNVYYIPGNGQPDAGERQVFLRVDYPARCDTAPNGWYYDSASSPMSIQLCASTCATVSGDPAGAVRIGLGCATVSFIP